MEELEDGVEAAGGGEAENEGNLDMAAEEAVPSLVVEPRPCKNKEVNDMTPDQAQAAAAHGLLTALQMQRLLGRPPLRSKELPR